MAKTVILLNPFGTDVTNFLNHTAFVPQLLKGTVCLPGDTLVTVPYPNTSGTENNVQGRELLHTVLGTAGDATDKLVFAYSQGVQPSIMWQRKYGISTPFNPAKLKFLHIGNADQPFGGFVYGHSGFNAVGDTLGYPTPLPYQTTDFRRQFDGVADFPLAPLVQNALVGFQAISSSPAASGDGLSMAAPQLYAAIKQIAQVAMSYNPRQALVNAISGMVLVHNNYLQVAVADPQNVSYTDPARPNLTYVTSPTFPVPALGFGGTFMDSDRALRTLVEKYTTRPVAIPLPLYSKAPWWGVAKFPGQP